MVTSEREKQQRKDIGVACRVWFKSKSGGRVRAVWGLVTPCSVLPDLGSTQAFASLTTHDEVDNTKNTYTMPGISATKSFVPALLRGAASTTSSSSSATVRVRVHAHPPLTRDVSSSPYGRTHVWKRRPKRLPNPVVPQFPQRVIRADGSSFTHWTTSPRSLIRLTRDVTNHPLWNVSALTGEGAMEESEVTGRLGRFNRKFVEEVDWMSEAAGLSSPTASTTPSKRKDGQREE